MSSENSGHYVVPIKYYIFNLIALMALTVLTVATAKGVELGGLGNILLAMFIATLKAMLVMCIFMGLAWDSWLNRSTMIFSFLFVGVFLWLTASDLWTRDNPQPMKVNAVAAGPSLDEVKAMMADTSLAEHGATVYAQNCNVCHGVDGRGDGAAGAALNPKPRNFYDESSKWTYGTSIESLYVTLTDGIPGTGMAGYPTLKPKDRLALAHFIRAKVPDAQSTGKMDAKFKDALAKDGIGGGGAAKKSIPANFALDRMLNEQ